MGRPTIQPNTLITFFYSHLYFVQETKFGKKINMYKHKGRGREPLHNHEKNGMSMTSYDPSRDLTFVPDLSKQ